MEDTENNVVYAGFWIRALATAIDTVILLVLVTLPLTLIYGVHDYWYSYEEYFLGFWDVMLGYVMPVIFTIWFWLRYQGTPGKILLKLQIVDAKTTTALTLRQAVVRYFGYFLSILVILLGFFWVAFDKRKQGWHDKLASTAVIRVNK
jgi:uncharacterized RDD family membrane protein YckC